MKKKIILIILILFIPINIFAFSSTAKSSIAMDIDSGRILYENNADEKSLIASITKIMTSVIALENGDFNKKIIVGEEILSMYGSNIYVELNEEILLKDLLYGLLMRSGNDAAIVIAKNISGSEEDFVKLMNKKAKEIGMKNTIYKNCHGLDENTQNYSTAKDMALLSRYAYQIEEYKKITNTRKYTLQTNKKSYVWYNRNKLLSMYEYATGGKTGYTPSAGKTLVSTAKKDNLNITIVTLKDSNLYETHKSLYEYIFNNYKKYTIIDKNSFKVDQNYFKDELYIKESFLYPLREKELENVETLISINKLKKYKNNDIVGNIKVLFNNEEIFKTNIYVKKIATKNLLKKILEKLKQLF